MGNLRKVFFNAQVELLDGCIMKSFDPATEVITWFVSDLKGTYILTYETYAQDMK